MADRGAEPGPAVVELLVHYPKKREVLGCDFEGLKEPEMVKDRPVVILSVSPARPELVLVAAISATEPIPLQPWHHPLSKDSLWDKKPRWVKCDMIYALSVGRLHPWKIAKDRNTGKRKYLYNHFLSRADFAAVQAGVLSALGIEPVEKQGPAEAGPMDQGT
jgi:uncharacterized protein YifN (PemK superfamily)